MKVRSLPHVFTNYFQSIAIIHSHNTRQATNNIIPDQKKMEMLKNLAVLCDCGTNYQLHKSSEN